MTRSLHDTRETLESLLQRTSRTFALAIPLLPDPTRMEVMLAYLVFRIADTLEDGERLPSSERAAALQAYADLLADPQAEAVQQFAEHWTSRRPCDDADYMELLAATPRVFAAVAECRPPAREAIRHHARRSALGMRTMLLQAQDAQLRLHSLEQLRTYCYYVAGIVGEMLTELFLLGLADGPASDLEQHARAFGEGLQLVNVLKDEEEDARRDRYFLPPNVDRATIFQLAREDLVGAQLYYDALARSAAPAGVRAFTLLPLRLAHLALDAVERHGPGAKVPRTDVFRVVRNVLAECHLDPTSI